MNNLISVDNKQVAIWDDKSQIDSIKQIYGNKLSAGEFKTFVEIGRATHLNPFLRELWAVKYGDNPAQIFIGRDGYRRSAQSNYDYDYHTVDAVYSSDTFEMVNGEITHKYNFTNRGLLIGAYCQVKRKSSSRPIYIFVDFKEYSTGKSLWNSKPATMIKKVAEAQGLRMAFQELFGGTYDESENWHNDNHYKKVQPKKGIGGLREKLGIDQTTSDDNIDIDTGEVTEVFDINYVKDKIETATNINQLVEAIDIARSLNESDKIIARKCYKEKELELSQTL